MWKKKNILVLFAVILSICLMGCGSIQTDESTDKPPSGFQWITGIEGAKFLLPGNLDTVKVNSFDEMDTTGQGYRLQTNDIVAYVRDDNYAIIECTVKDLSDTSFRKTMEEKAHLRIMQLEKTGEAYEGELTAYACAAEGLFSEDLYGDYIGNLTALKTKDQYLILFAGTTTQNPSTQTIAYSLNFEQGEKKQNKGRIGKDSGNGKDLKDATINQYGDVEVLYKQKDKDARIVHFGLRLVNIQKDADDTIKKMLADTPISDLPSPDDGYTWMTAAFDVDSRGYDVSAEVPPIPVRICDSMGKEINHGRTYLLKGTDNELVIFFEAHADEDFIVKAGAEHPLTIHCEKEDFS